VVVKTEPGANPILGIFQLRVTSFGLLYRAFHTLATLTPRKTLFELLCESRMNLSDLEVPPPQQVQRTSTEASDKDADVRPHCFLQPFYYSKSCAVSLSTTPEQTNPRQAIP
jgi:hypothetical protein